jgi:hypothetical protein
MSKINLGRVVGGGLLAGLVMNVVDAVTNGALLGAQWQAEGQALSPTLMATPGLETMSMAGWVIVDFLTGIALVWLYAAIRPRFGPGPRTALVAALVTWLVGHLSFASYAFNGLYSVQIVAAASAGALVATLAGGLAGGWLYRE